MLKKLITVTVLSVVGTTGLLAGGCTSTTGTANATAQRDNERKYTDQKGRYRTDLAITRAEQD